MWVVWLFEWPFLSRALLFSGMHTVDCFRKGEISLGLPLLLFLAGGGGGRGRGRFYYCHSFPPLSRRSREKEGSGRERRKFK